MMVSNAPIHLLNWLCCSVWRAALSIQNVAPLWIYGMAEYSWIVKDILPKIIKGSYLLANYRPIVRAGGMEAELSLGWLFVDYGSNLFEAKRTKGPWCLGWQYRVSLTRYRKLEKCFVVWFRLINLEENAQPTELVRIYSTYNGCLAIHWPLIVDKSQPSELMYEFWSNKN